MKGFIEVTQRDGDDTKHLVNLDHVRRIGVQGRKDRECTVVEFAGDGLRWIVKETYPQVLAMVENAGPAPAKRKGE